MDQTDRIKLLKNKVECIAEYSGKLKKMFFIEWETFCNCGVMD